MRFEPARTSAANSSSLARLAAGVAALLLAGLAAAPSAALAAGNGAAGRQDAGVELAAGEPLPAGRGDAAPVGKAVVPGTGRVSVGQLPLRDAIVQVNGSGARRLYVFFDPGLPQAAQFEASLGQLADVTIFTFLAPMSSHDARDVARRYWAVAMPERALEMQVLDQNIELARSLSIRSTPALIRADGAVVSGMMPLPELTAWVAAGSAVLQAAR